jgi:hypothetical protein
LLNDIKCQILLDLFLQAVCIQLLLVAAFKQISARLAKDFRLTPSSRQAPRDTCEKCNCSQQSALKSTCKIHQTPTVSTFFNRKSIRFIPCGLPCLKCGKLQDLSGSDTSASPLEHFVSKTFGGRKVVTLPR